MKQFEIHSLALGESENKCKNNTYFKHWVLFRDIPNKQNRKRNC